MIVNEGGGVRLPNLTNPAAASDLLINKQLIDAEGRIVNGTMPIVTHPNPSIIVGANGLITASHEQETGKVTGGTTQSTHQLTVQNGTTITPGTAQKTAVASGRYTTGPVYVAGDANLKASNIKSGISIFGLIGTYNALDIRAKTGVYINDGSSAFSSFTIDIDSEATGLVGIEVMAIDAYYHWDRITLSPSTTFYVAFASGYTTVPQEYLWLDGHKFNIYGKPYPDNYIGLYPIPMNTVIGPSSFGVKLNTYGNQKRVLFNMDYDQSKETNLMFAGADGAPSGIDYKIFYTV